MARLPPHLTLRLTPHGHLLAEEDEDADACDQGIAPRLRDAFAHGSGPGLLQLGGAEVGTILPPVFAWWRGFAARYVTEICHLSLAFDEGAASAPMPPEVPPPTEAELAAWVLAAPLMIGSEYLTVAVLRALWAELGTAFATAMAESDMDLVGFLRHLSPTWTRIGRVHFNLAENHKDPEFPFAFMATYTTHLSTDAKAQHVPLARALQEYAGVANKDRLLALLLPMQRAAQGCAWLKAMIDSAEIFRPQRWTVSEASRFLASLPGLETAGIVARMPALWRSQRPPRPVVTATVGTRPPSGLGLEGLLDFRVAVTLEGEPLTAAERDALLASTEGLVWLRGRWVEIDSTRLQRSMGQLRAAEELARREGLDFASAMRLLASASLAEDVGEAVDPDWSRVVAGPWLKETLGRLRAPDGSGADPGPALRGTLRPYQRAGVEWLHLLSGLGLGACLADDMGLGKTIQVLSLLLVRQRAEAGAEAGVPYRPAARSPSLLVAPASLLANWMAEIERFAPSLRALILHPSAMTAEAIQGFSAEQARRYDLVLTSYGSVPRLPRLLECPWGLVILDEAQAIKNPGAQQTKAVKQIKAQARVALTGTPVENHLGDLWSLFDFINPALLGSLKQFKKYTKNLAKQEKNPYGPLRELVRPYILRRMKTDRTIIEDLPDKTETKAYCPLSRKQAALYMQAVEELATLLRETEGIQRKGVVLAMLMRLKQICNHPSQWLGDHEWREADSGKWARLRDIAEVVAARQEKMLLFTQFSEIAAPLAAFLAGVFGRPGLVLHGATAVKHRKALVQRFQDDEAVPFFVLSLKAGGAGLTLTAASHVVHFDRWWNPAVEDQATDRAFRIGQKKNVLVHKFICRGTVEEKVDAMIEAKTALARDLLEGQSEIHLTEMKDEEILQLVALHLHSAMQE